MTSGFAAAYRLGADFPFQGDSECERLFKLYLGLSHGVRAVSSSLSKSLVDHAADKNSEEGGSSGILRLTFYTRDVLVARV